MTTVRCQRPRRSGRNRRRRLGEDRPGSYRSWDRDVYLRDAATVRVRCGARWRDWRRRFWWLRSRVTRSWLARRGRTGTARVHGGDCAPLESSGGHPPHAGPRRGPVRTSQGALLPSEVVLMQRVRLAEFLLDRADEARRLCTRWSGSYDA